MLSKPQLHPSTNALNGVVLLQKAEAASVLLDWNFEESGHKIGHSEANAELGEGGKSL